MENYKIISFFLNKYPMHKYSNYYLGNQKYIAIFSVDNISFLFINFFNKNKEREEFHLYEYC